MRRFTIAAISGCLLLAGAAQGAENWESFGFTTTAICVGFVHRAKIMQREITLRLGVTMTIQAI